MSPHERIVATSDPGSPRKHEKRPLVRLCDPTGLWDYSMRQVGAPCAWPSRGMMAQISMCIICEGACRRPRSTRAHPLTRHASHPHLEAPPRPPATSGPRFQPAPSSRRARTAQLSHLTRNSKITRARGPGATRGPSQRYARRL